ncbi:hypothetical protein QVD17_31634 [Tagetes erecta]|uniref:Uncharacterized protein n=1 Tax=Tagetes erecta TaxID=13708 RepID=A0AAD8NPE7_TARER|nr:hypothetical protein QVD17_31634 [Tagetes erecta]
MKSILQHSLDAAKSIAPDTILQTGTDLVNQAQDTTNSLTGGIPLVGDATQSLVPNPVDLASQIANATSSLVNENPVLETVNSVAQNSLDATKSLAPDTILQKGSDLVNQAQDTTNSLAGGIPLVGNVAESIVTNPVELASQIANTTNTLVNENPVLEAVNSVAQESVDTATSLTPDAILQKGTDLVNQAQDTATSLTGGIPLVSNAAQSILTNTTNLANQVANTTNSLVSENPILEAANSATQNIGNKPQATGTKAALQSAYMTLKLAMIPVIAQLWYEVVNKYPTVADLSEFILPVVECVCTLYNKVVTYMDEKGYSIFGYLPLVPVDEIKAAYKLVKTSSDALSSVGDLLGTQNNKGLSAVEDLLGMNKSNNTTSNLANQAQDTTESLVGGIPLVSNAAQSILTNTTNLANQAVNATTSLVSDNPILEAANSATQNIGNKPQATGTKAALQSAYKTLKLAMIPVIAQLWYAIVNKYPLVDDLSGFILPVIECMCKLYNKMVTYMDGKGYSVFGYLPLVPVDEIEAAYKLLKTSSDGLSAIGDLLGTHNNEGLSAVGDLLGMKKNN